MAMTNPPIIAYHNVLRDDGAVISASAPGHSAAYDWRLDRAWTVNTAGLHFIEVQLPSASYVDYLAFFAHNLSASAAQIGLAYWDGSQFTLIAPMMQPTGPACVCKLFAGVHADRFRVLIDAPAAFTLGAVSLGKRLALDSGLQSGFIPAHFSEQATVLNTVSEKGLLLGRSIRQHAGKLTINAPLNDEHWMRDYWLPFKQHALRFPFFFVWNSETFPLEAAYCWTAAAPNANAYTQTGYMQATLGVHALTELVV